MDATVLLVMDVQRGIVERFAEDPGYLQRLAGAITAARGAGVPVVYVIIGFRPGHPEISARNQTFSALAAAGGYVEGDPAAEIHPAVAPGPGDLVVTKRRVSAFTGSDLDVVLRGHARPDRHRHQRRGAVHPAAGRRPRLRADRPRRRLPRRRPRGPPGPDREGVPAAGGGVHRGPVGGAAGLTVMVTAGGPVSGGPPWRSGRGGRPRGDAPQRACSRR